MDYVLIRYLHLLAILVLVAAVVGEHLLLKRELSAQEIRRLARLDGVYGVSAMTALGAGLVLWLMVGKPAEFYSRNPVFHLKVTLFVIVALLSIYPTIFFLRQRKATSTVAVPRRLYLLLRLELVLLLLIPLLAVLMAQGYGLR